MNYRSPVEQSNVNIMRKKRPVEVKSRRRAVHEKKSPNKSLMIFVAVFVFVAVVITASLTVLFRVDRVDVAGNTRYTADEIVLASGLKTGKNLFLTATKDAPDKLYDEFPYIETVQIKRKLPGRLLINVTESEPFAEIPIEGGFKVINKDGRLLEQPEKSLGILRLECAQENVTGRQSTIKPEILKDVTTLTEIIEQLGLEGVSCIDLSSETSISVVYEDRVTIKLGTMIDADLKLRSCQVKIQELNAAEPGKKWSMDCRFYTPENPNVIFVRVN